MFNDVIVGVLIVICVITGIWGWWVENGPSGKNQGNDQEKDLEGQETGKAEENENVVETDER